MKFLIRPISTRRWRKGSSGRVTEKRSTSSSAKARTAEEAGIEQGGDFKKVKKDRTRQSEEGGSNKTPGQSQQLLRVDDLLPKKGK